MLVRAWIILAAGLPAAFAAASGVSLREYIHTIWNHHDGIPLSVRSITQTPDGYLWITTDDEGLLRFDGVRFVGEPSPCGRVNVTQARAASDGSLWMICDYRLYRRDPAGKTSLVQQTLLPADLRPATALYIDKQDRVWLWGHELGFLRPDGTEGQRIAGTAREGRAMNCHFAEDSSGNLWFAANDKLLRIRDGTAEQIMTGLFTGIGRGPAGRIVAVKERQVFQLDGTAVVSTATLPAGVSLSGGNKITTTGGSIWLGTHNTGMALIRGGKVEVMPFEDAQPAPVVGNVYQDREGTIWVGTSSGLHRFREPLARLMSPAEGVPPGTPLMTFADRAGNLWITAQYSARVDAASGRSFRLPERYQGIAQDRSGRIWVSTNDEFGYLEEDRMVRVRDPAGTAIPGVRSIHPDADSGVWALSVTNGLYRAIGTRATLEPAGGIGIRLAVSSEHGIWIAQRERITRILNGERTVLETIPITGGDTFSLQARGDSLWVGTTVGLSRWRNGKWTNWSGAHGLPGRGAILEITSDEMGRAWLMSDAGIIAFPWSQVEQTPDGEPKRLTFFRIGGLDRIVPHRGGIGASPRTAADREGRLLFATANGVAMVAPAALNEAALAPRIVLESLLVNRQSTALRGANSFVEPEEVQFEYTSLSLRNPENIRFRYRLDGRDDDWVEAGSQRRAIYSALKPGTYRFHVIGSGSEGVWNEEGASYEFRVQPVYWRTWSFRLALLCAFALAIAGAHRLRMRQVARTLNARFEERLAERTRIAQDLHDTLLQGCISASMQLEVASDRLPEDYPEKPRFTRVSELLRLVVDEGRIAVRGLRGAQPWTSDLAQAFSNMKKEVTGDPQVDFRIVVRGETRVLHPIIQDEIHHIGREALLNAFRHSAAGRIEIELDYAQRSFRLSVRDNGRGIDAAVLSNGREGHWGLRGMRERADRIGGQLHVWSAPAGGTEIELSVPGHVAFPSKPA